MKNNIRSILQDKGVTNIRIVRLLDMSKSTFYRRLSGHGSFTPDQLSKISDFLSIPVESLFDGKDTEDDQG